MKRTTVKEIKKWFKTLQNYGEKLNEPLAELYIYSFLSDRTNDLHEYYLEDVKTNTYYENLLTRLKEQYPEAPYTKQYEAELKADEFVVNGDKSIPWWIYFLGVFAALSILGNFARANFFPHFICICFFPFSTFEVWSPKNMKFSKKMKF